MIYTAIEVMYSCEGCGLVKTKVNVVSRAEDEDILDWMKKLTAAVSRDHTGKSPRCRSGRMSEVYIPIDQDRGIGMPVSMPVTKKAN